MISFGMSLIIYTSTNIGRTTLDAWHQWQEVHKQPSPPVVQHKRNRVQGNNSVWEKPREAWLKCNVDAVFHDSNILHLLRVMLETLVVNLLELKQNGSGQI